MSVLLAAHFPLLTLQRPLLQSVLLLQGPQVCFVVSQVWSVQSSLVLHWTQAPLVPHSGVVGNAVIHSSEAPLVPQPVQMLAVQLGAVIGQGMVSEQTTGGTMSVPPMSPSVMKGVL